MKGLYGVIHKLLAGPVRFVFNVRVENRENEPEPDSGACLVCCNHISDWDAIWLAVSLRKRHPHYMAKSQLFKYPAFAAFLRKLGAFPVERGHVDMESIRTVFKLVGENKCVAIFPQGTRCMGVDPTTSRVKSGVGMIAVRLGIPVLPVYIRTKRFKSYLFGRKTVIIGETIKPEVLRRMREEDRMSYQEISRYIFDRICELGGLKRKEPADGGENA